MKYNFLLGNNKTLLKNINFSHKLYNNIPIAYGLNNRYIYPTIVSITSIMETINSKKKYDFYIMHSGDFSEKNKKNLKKKYKQCSINLIDMKDMFKEGTKYNTRIPVPPYYRLILSDLLPNIDKIIYLDGDWITYIDIKEMYDLDMENYYYKGYRVWSRKFNHKFINNYICSGVLLINLKELRKNNITQQYYKFI